jgi:hypothetical protein
MLVQLLELHCLEDRASLQSINANEKAKYKLDTTTMS